MVETDAETDHGAMEYLLVSVPANPTRADAKKVLNNGTSSVSAHNTFTIPNLRVGTLDALVALSDDLTKIDTFVENVTRKLVSYMSDLITVKSQLQEHLVLSDSRPVDKYLQSFEWDSARYNTKLSIRELADTISQQVSHVEAEMKGRVSLYQKVKGNLQAIERKTTGSLLIRSLTGLVEPSHCVNSSEYMVTLMVVVQKAAYKQWEKTYEKLNEYVVPRSSELVSEDAEYGLFSVTVFRKMQDDFKQAAREQKFIVRDFELDADSEAAGELEVAALKSDISRKFTTLVQWCGASFSDAFTSWVHIKALRVFVESVLRYGLPPNFHVAVLEFNKKTTKRVRTVLQGLYAHLDRAGEASAGEVLEVAGLGPQQKYYPYVNFDIPMTDMMAIR